MGKKGKNLFKVLPVGFLRPNGRFRALVLLFFMIFSSCGEYAKVLKSTDYAWKKEMAIAYYQKKKYAKALTLFEELYGLIRGGAEAEDITYYYAYSHYYVGDFLLANYFFDLFSATYPRSARYREAYYMSGYCLYKASPAHQLDPTSTRDAINRLQVYIDRFPESDEAKKAGELIDELRGRLEVKAFRAATMYFDQGYYVAAVKSYEQVLRDYPDTPKRAEIYYQILRSHFLYAEKSVRTKRSERYAAVSENFSKFATQLQETPFFQRSKQLSVDAEKMAKFFEQTTSE
jgi:outer membrane protein assembly factor BamD